MYSLYINIQAVPKLNVEQALGEKPGYISSGKNYKKSPCLLVHVIINIGEIPMKVILYRDLELIWCNSTL